MTLSFDLADLVQPLVIAVPGVGDLELEIHGDLADWLAASAGRKVWPTGQDLVRDLLATRTAKPGDTPLSVEAVSGLIDEDVDAVASAILAGASFVLRPKWIELKRTGKRVHARRRKKTEAYDMAPREGEAAADQLLRISQDLNLDRQLEESARLSEALGPNHEYIMDVLNRADRVEAAVKATGVLDYLDADTPLARAMAAADHTKLGKIGHGLHGSVFNATKAASVGRGLEGLTLAERAAAGIAPSVIAAARGVDISAFSAVQKAAMGIDLSGLTAARRAAQGIDLSGLASIGRGLIDPDLMRTYAIGADIARFARANPPVYEAFNDTLLAQTRALQAAVAMSPVRELALTASTLSIWSENQNAYLAGLHRHMRVARPLQD